MQMNLLDLASEQYQTLDFCGKLHWSELEFEGEVTRNTFVCATVLCRKTGSDCSKVGQL